MEFNTNWAELVGTILMEPQSGVIAVGKATYVYSKTIIEVERASGTRDNLILYFPRTTDTSNVKVGNLVHIRGSVFTYFSRNYPNDRKHLNITIWVNEIKLVENLGLKGKNKIEICGIIRKAPELRETPLGRTVTEFLVELVNRKGKRIVIPCVCWGNMAIEVSKLDIGDRIGAIGRMQSREYTKRYIDGSCEKKVAYEVSLNQIEFLCNKF